MSILSTAAHAALTGTGKRPDVQQELAPGGQPEKTSPQKYGEALTKYIPTEIIGIVTGIYAVIVPLAKGKGLEVEAAGTIAAIGLLSLIGLFWLELVATAKKADKNAKALSVAFKPCALGELSLLIVCYLLWVASLLSTFLSALVSATVGILGIVFIHLAEPIRRVVVTEECK